MKKLILIYCTIIGISIYSEKLEAQNDTVRYLAMHVNNAILDCPHFQGLFKQMEKRNGWEEVERNLKDKYIIYAYPSDINYDIVAKFKDELNQMHFPMGVIDDIYTKEKLQEIGPRKNCKK